jgi:hypothetical protein
LVFETGFFLLLSDGVGVVVVSCKIVARLIFFPYLWFVVFFCGGGARIATGFQPAPRPNNVVWLFFVGRQKIKIRGRPPPHQITNPERKRENGCGRKYLLISKRKLLLNGFLNCNVLHLAVTFFTLLLPSL